MSLSSKEPKLLVCARCDGEGHTEHPPAYERKVGQRFIRAECSVCSGAGAWIEKNFMLPRPIPLSKNVGALNVG